MKFWLSYMLLICRATAFWNCVRFLSVLLMVFPLLLVIQVLITRIMATRTWTLLSPLARVMSTPPRPFPFGLAGVSPPLLIGHFLCFGFFPVASDFPVCACATRAALPLLAPVRRIASYTLCTLVPFGIVCY